MKRIPRRLLSLLLCLVLCGLLLPVPEARAYDYVDITSITATSDVSSILQVGGKILPVTFNITSTNQLSVSGGKWYHMIDGVWKAAAFWESYIDARFSAGIWMYTLEIDNKDNPLYHLSSDTKFIVDGREWQTRGCFSSGDTYEITVQSPSFQVSSDGVNPVIAVASVTITEPEVGKHPDYEPRLPAGVQYYSDTYSSLTMLNDVLWRDMNESRDLAVKNGIFKGGHEYKVTIYLTPKDGYSFVDDPVCRVNGNPATSYLVRSDGQLQMEYVFPALPAPEIIDSPGNEFVTVGASVSFYVIARGAENYQWQYKAPTQSEWKNVEENGNDSQYSVTATAALDGYQYRCIVSNGAGDTISSAGTLHVYTKKPTITAQPQNVAADPGEQVSFQVTASNDPMQYQWQYREPDASGWSNVSYGCLPGASPSGNKLYINAETELHCYQFRCIVSNVVGSVTSSAATLTVNGMPTITAQPENVSAKPGQTAEFSVTATGSGRTYRWQYLVPGSDWTDCDAAGANTKTLSVTVTAGMNGYQYRCIVTNSVGSIASSAATLTIASSWQKIDGKWYYYENGVPVKGWKQISGKWYYFDSTGVMKTGWQKISSKWYYFNSSGAMVTGWQKLSNKWYYFNSSGVMLTGTQQIGGKWYYFESSGAMYATAGWKQISGKWYYFDSAGVAQTGWKQVSGKWYWFNSSAQMATGWKQISGKWYYFNTSGVMQTGWQTIGGKSYYFQSGGAMVTGVQQIGGKWYYFESSGAQYKTGGWKQINSKWYYFDSAGVAKVGWLKENGKWYYFNASAQMVTGWQKIDGKWYWFSTGGVMFSNGDKTISGKTYHFDKNGVCTNP